MSSIDTAASTPQFICHSPPSPLNPANRSIINQKFFFKIIGVNLATVLAEEPTNLFWCPKTQKPAGLGLVHKITGNFINNTEHDSCSNISIYLTMYKKIIISIV